MWCIWSAFRLKPQMLDGAIRDQCKFCECVCSNMNGSNCLMRETHVYFERTRKRTQRLGMKNRIKPKQVDPGSKPKYGGAVYHYRIFPLIKQNAEVDFVSCTSRTIME